MVPVSIRTAVAISLEIMARPTTTAHLLTNSRKRLPTVDLRLRLVNVTALVLGVGNFCRAESRHQFFLFRSFRFDNKHA